MKYSESQAKLIATEKERQSLNNYVKKVEHSAN